MKVRILKKLLAGATTLAMAAQFAFVLPASAKTNSVSYTFEDSNAVFTGDSRITVAIESDSTLSSNVVGFTCAGNAQNGYSFAHYNFSELVKGALSTTVEFDYYNTKGGRAIINLGDASVRGTTGNSSKQTYSSDGVAFNLGSNKDYAIVQGANNTLATFTNKWMHVKVTIDESANTLTYTVTDTSGSTLASAENVAFLNTEASQVSQIDLFGYINSSHCAMVDNLSITSEISESEVYTVAYYSESVKVGEESVIDGNYPVKVPDDPTKTGYLFKGWYKDSDTTTVYTATQIKAMAITANTTFKAVFEKDADYIEPMASVSFTTSPSGGTLEGGADTSTAASNNFDISVTGELGTDLINNPDSRVDDFKVEYTLNGFNWKANSQEATADSEEWPYCDSYGRLVTSGTAADFQIKNNAFNYYGTMTATVTYNGETKSVTTPIVYMGDSSANYTTGQVLPRAGYYEDANAYAPDMVGYQATTSSNNKSATDVVTDNWAAYGGNTKTVTLQEEDGSRFFRLEAFGTSSSSFAANQIDAVTDTQVVFDQYVRFHTASSTILLKSANPVTWGTGATTFAVNFTGSEINLNGGTAITEASTGTWYRILITSDVTSGKCYAEVYAADGTTKLGSSDVLDFSDSASTNPTYYMFRTPDKSTGKLDFNKVKITRASIDEDTIATTTSAETIAIPETSGETATATVTVSAKTTEGLPAIGKAEWSIADDTIDGVTITPSDTDSQTATVTVASGATPGVMPIKVLVGGASATLNITLTSSQDSVQFTESASGISIPLSGSTSQTYAARVVDGDGNPISGKTVTYALYDSKNASEIEAPEGTTFENGVLTVTSEAKACVVYIRANSENSSDEPISKAIKVDIHGLAFDFGAGTEEDVVSGYTAVTPSSTYSDKTGYGIEGTATAGGEASTEDASTDYLEGTYTFKAAVPNNKIYNVTITYMGSLASEYINSDLAGVSLSNTELSEVTYEIPVFDGVLDLALSGTDAKIASIEIEQQDDKTARDLPNVFSVGDSTISARENGGTSWATQFGSTYSNYSDFAALATFTNNGRGSRNLCSYYTEGCLRSILTQVKPDDYVMIGCMGTNGMGSYYETDLNEYIDECLAMGAKVILYSYTPHGAVGDYASGYDSETHTFNSYRQDSYDNIVRSTYETRKSELAGFVEIGKNADAAFNAYVADYAANGYDSEDAAAQAIISCFADHNHYYNGTIARDLMLNGYGDTKGIVAQLVDILGGSEPEPSPEPEIEPVAPLVDKTGDLNAEGDNAKTSDRTIGWSLEIDKADGKSYEFRLYDGTTAKFKKTADIVNDDSLTGNVKVGLLLTFDPSNEAFSEIDGAAITAMD